VGGASDADLYTAGGVGSEDSFDDEACLLAIPTALHRFL